MGPPTQDPNEENQMKTYATHREQHERYMTHFAEKERKESYVYDDSIPIR